MKKDELLKEFFKNSNINVHGLENIPNYGTNIYFSNHLCMNDIFLLKYILKDAVNIVSSNSLFKEGERKELYNKLLTPFPLEVRAGKNYTDVCLEKITDLLINRINIIIFPEGVFSDNNKLYKAHTGAVRTLFKAKEINNNINVVPICIEIKDLDDEKKQMNKPWDNFTVNITILKTFNYETYYNKYKENNDNDMIRILTDDVMLEIAKTKDVPYMNEYGKLYDIDGFFFPNGKYITFEESDNKEYQDEYKSQIDEIYNSIINNKDI